MWGSPICGTCWRLVFNDSNSVDVLVVDDAVAGFAVSLEAIALLVGSEARARELLRVYVMATQEPVKLCEID